MELSKATLDELTANRKTPGDVEKLFSQMLQHMINRSLEAEMQAQVGHATRGRSGGNVRNGKSRKGVRSALGDLQIQAPRDREGSFEPQLVKKRQVHLTHLDSFHAVCPQCALATSLPAFSNHPIPQIRARKQFSWLRRRRWRLTFAACAASWPDIGLRRHDFALAMLPSAFRRTSRLIVEGDQVKHRNICLALI